MQAAVFTRAFAAPKLAENIDLAAVGAVLVTVFEVVVAGADETLSESAAHVAVSVITGDAAATTVFDVAGQIPVFVDPVDAVVVGSVANLGCAGVSARIDVIAIDAAALSDRDVAVFVAVRAADAAIAWWSADASKIVLARGAANRPGRAEVVWTARRCTECTVAKGETRARPALIRAFAWGAPADIFGHAQFDALAVRALTPVTGPAIRTRITLVRGTHSRSVELQHAPGALALVVSFARTADFAFAIGRVGEVRRGVCRIWRGVCRIRRRVCRIRGGVRVGSVGVGGICVGIGGIGAGIGSAGIQEWSLVGHVAGQRGNVRRADPFA
ncbi:MAG: hypothetical protein ACJAYU_001435 [Bradymonadia bacterium]